MSRVIPFQAQLPASESTENKCLIERTHITVSNIPYFPTMATTQEIFNCNLSVGIDTGPRTHERSLLKINGRFGVRCDDLDAKPRLWYRVSSSNAKMSNAKAYALMMLEKTVLDFMPPQIVDEIKDEFAQANKTLSLLAKNSPNNALLQWKNKCIILKKDSAKLLTGVEQEHFTLIKSALFKETELDISFANNSSGNDITLRVLPKELIQLDGRVLLKAIKTKCAQEAVVIDLTKIKTVFNTDDSLFGTISGRRRAA